MARWIGEARAAERDEDSNDENDALVVASNMRAAKWKPATLAALFGGQELLTSRPPSMAMNVEAVLMEALAEAEEDERLDDGAVEICSDEEYNG
jgi:hypothetical protein